MRDITKIKKADNLSTLNETDKSGASKSKLKENTEFFISTDKEDTRPEIEPDTAKTLPATLAHLSLLAKTRDPTAPIPNSNKDIKNIVDEEMVVSI